MLCRSEADYPYETIYWQASSITPEQLLQRTGHTPDTPVEVWEQDWFFSPATQEPDWHGEEERAEVKRYRVLLDFLKKHLSDIKVYRVGSVEVDVYIVGTTESGNLAGLSTKVVET